MKDNTIPAFIIALVIGCGVYELVKSIDRLAESPAARCCPSTKDTK